MDPDIRLALIHESLGTLSDIRGRISRLGSYWVCLLLTDFLGLGLLSLHKLPVLVLMGFYGLLALGLFVLGFLTCLVLLYGFKYVKLSRQIKTEVFDMPISVLSKSRIKGIL